jgi:manganese oxidase
MKIDKRLFASILSSLAVMLVLISIPGSARAQEPGPQTGKAQNAQTKLPDQPAPQQVQAISTPKVAEEEAAGSSATPTKGTPTEGSATAKAAPAIACTTTVKANVVAINQFIMLNRLGAAIPTGWIFALKSDVEGTGQSAKLKYGKRPRPIVLRVNQGDCLQITLENWLELPPSNPDGSIPLTTPLTGQISIHVQGMQVVNNISDDGSFVGRNNSSLVDRLGNANGNPPNPSMRVYTLYAKDEGTFLLYTMGDTSTTGTQLARGLFGAVNVQPAGAEWYRSQVTRADLAKATVACPAGTPAGSPPCINYNATDPNGRPILKMVDANNNLMHSDLTAIITGPNAGRFPGVKGVNQPDPDCNAENDPNVGNPAIKKDPSLFNPLFCGNPASPDRKQPYREVTIIYHEVGLVASQAFPVFKDPNLANTVASGADAFAINYGTGGIGSEIYANRVGVGPMGGCIDCKYEEFFLSAWPVGDPAQVVDKPANAPCTQEDVNPPPGSQPNPNCVNPTGTRTPAGNAFPYKMTPVAKATKTYFPDDPSNVYHSYMNDHVKFRILHGGTGVTHVHHQHAHQWLQSPNSDQSSYLDSQMISPGASYTLEMVYNGSGNRNKTVGDSIFHCHFYPHFAAGMWAMWRVHDVFEAGTELEADGVTVKTGVNRALPDGEIATGTPIPAIVPMPTLPMAPMPAKVQIVPACADTTNCTGKPKSDWVGYKAEVVPADLAAGKNPGFPFFIPGIAGARAPHPPMDFAPDGANFLDGGLPRHIITTGTVAFESHDKFDWSKDSETLQAVKLPEDGTQVEKIAMSFAGKRCHSTIFPNGAAANCAPNNIGGFIMNGLPNGPQPGAPFADPAVNDQGQATGRKITYKAAAIQLDVTFNKQPWAWHYPQQRMLTLWQDVRPTLGGTRPPEPLFFRGNTGDVIEYWHTNLVPNYFLVDDFQVRTPTDIIGQHIHLVKFDVTSSDGAGNGFNYEDGTLSPPEVQEIIHAVNDVGGIIVNPQSGQRQQLTAKLPPADILNCANNPGDKRCQPCAAGDNNCTSWVGAQTTIQRWFVDDLLDNAGTDRTLRTVFTHDHFGPSTHQQIGLYAGLLAEPKDSKWRIYDPSNNTTTTVTPGVPSPGRNDGGPTSWRADILTANQADSYREFALEYQDFQLAYKTSNNPPNPYPNPSRSTGYRDPNNAIDAPVTPQLVSTGIKPPPGTQIMNYLNEPLAMRVTAGSTIPPGGTKKISPTNMSSIFSSNLKMAVNLPPVGDPKTPLLRTYENDNVQIRVLVGAHMFAHYFNIFGPTWFSEPSWKDSGYRSSQAAGLSEHFEFLFKAPPSAVASSTRKCPDGKSNGDCVDYLYSPSFDDSGLSNGVWGIFRAYSPKYTATNLEPLPNNPIATSYGGSYAACPADAPVKNFAITAVTAQNALSDRSPVPGSNPKVGQLVYNDRGAGREPASPDPNKVMLRQKLGIMYVYTKDLTANTQNGKLKAGVPIEPLIIRASAGDCIKVTLTNAVNPNAAVFTEGFQFPVPFNSFGNVNLYMSPSKYVGLHPQLLAYNTAQNSGFNVGWNGTNQTVAPGQQTTYTWYAGNAERDSSGNMKFTPVEFGSLNLFPSDPLFQHINGLFGGMVIEPKNTTWQCGEVGSLAKCDPDTPGLGTYPPTTRASATVTFTAPNTERPTQFREFVAMVHDDLRLSNNNSSAINYRTEPTFYRYGSPNASAPAFAAKPPFANANDNACALSNQLVLRDVDTAMSTADPKTPIFTANPGQAVIFRLIHPMGTGTSQVFTLHGHPWQRNPYTGNSTGIGDQVLSQWMGSRDNHGATDHADLVVAKAGGENIVSGDYLYTVFLPNQNNLGAWGVFRVGNLNTPTIFNSSCIVPTTAQPYTALRPSSAGETQPTVTNNIDVKNIDRFIRTPTPANKENKP